MASSSWEHRDYSFLVADPTLPGDDSDAETDVEDLSPDECSARLFAFLVSLKMAGTLSAKQVATIAFWARGAGCRGQAADLALSPTRTGGGYSEHFDRVVGIREEMQKDWYNLSVPTHAKHDLSRSIKNFAANPPYEALGTELAEMPNFRKDLAAMEKTWADNVVSHPLVREHGVSNVVPVGIYIDGVQYQRRGSTIGFWMINLLTQRRHLLACIPKRDLCRCGCKGYCSLFVVLSFIEWGFEAMARGRCPEEQHTGEPWPAGVSRSAVAGEALGFRAACVIVKGDWAEFASTLAFRAWNHHAHPCFRCCATGGPAGNIASHSGLSVLSEPWPQKGMDELEAACDRCEVVVMINSRPELTMLLAALYFDKRKSGSCGRALKRDLPALNLRRHDRLEPTRGVPDVCAVDGTTNFPLRLVFWRPSEESLARHRCPMFSRRSGILPSLLCVDELHTMHLGVFQDFILAVLWKLVDCEAFHPRGGLPDDAHCAAAALALRTRLFSWCRAEKQREPGKPLYEMADFTLSTIGTRDRPALAAKAAESGTLLMWAHSLATEYQRALPSGRALVECGKGLVEYMQVTRQSDLRMSAADRQRVADGIVRFLHFRESAGVAWKPKAHLSSHMIADAKTFGNPFRTGTWLDEGLNKDLANVCAAAHSLVWSQRVLASFAHASGPAARAANSARKRKTRS